MIQIRQGVFETNSSSTHSIVVQKKRKPTLPHYLDRHGGFASYEDGVVTINEDNDFGWGWDVLDCWLDRLAYALADLEGEQRKELIAVLAEHYGIQVAHGYRDEYWPKKGKCPDYGYVDHQSYGTLQKMLSASGISAIDFIFDDRYIVILDNDNCDNDCYNAYIAKLDVEEEYRKHRWW